MITRFTSIRIRASNDFRSWKWVFVSVSNRHIEMELSLTRLQLKLSFIYLRVKFLKSMPFLPVNHSWNQRNHIDLIGIPKKKLLEIVYFSFWVKWECVINNKTCVRYVNKVNCKNLPTHKKNHPTLWTIFCVLKCSVKFYTKTILIKQNFHRWILIKFIFRSC